MSHEKSRTQAKTFFQRERASMVKEESKEYLGNTDTEFEWSFWKWSDSFGSAEHVSMNRGHEQEK